jgi:dTDP-glucose 4,6-dehydratase
VLNFAAESHVDRSIMARPISSRPTSSAPSACWKPCASYSTPACRPRTTGVPLPAGVHRRGVRLAAPDDPAFSETHRYEPNSPYSASKAASDHLVRAWHHTYGLPVLTTNCSNNYGPYHFPEKLIPLMIVNALAGKPLPVYGDGHAGARLAVRQGPLQRHPPRARSRPPGRDLQHRRLEREAQHRHRAHGLRAAGRVAPARGWQLFAAGHVREGPARPRPPLRHRCRKIERELGWKPAETFETGIRKTVQWYLDNPGG